MERIKLRTIIIVTVVVTIGIFILYVIKFNNGLSTEPENWNAFGSYFGGVLAAFFSGASFILLISNYKEQKIQNTEERIRSDKNLNNLRTQIEALKDQSFNGRFFGMLNQKSAIIESYSLGNSSGAEEIIKKMHQDLEERNSDNRARAKRPYKNIYKFLNLFNFIITISQTIEEDSPDNKKSEYYKILRNTLSSGELKMIIIIRDIEKKELSYEYKKNINKILGEKYSEMVLSNLENKPKKSFFEIAMDEGIYN